MVTARQYYITAWNIDKRRFHKTRSHFGLKLTHYIYIYKKIQLHNPILTFTKADTCIAHKWQSDKLKKATYLYNDRNKNVWYPTGRSSYLTNYCMFDVLSSSDQALVLSAWFICLVQARGACDWSAEAWSVCGLKGHAATSLAGVPAAKERLQPPRRGNVCVRIVLCCCSFSWYSDKEACPTEVKSQHARMF